MRSLWLIIGMYTSFCYGLEIAVERQLQEQMVNMQENSALRPMEQRLCCQRSCVVPTIALIVLVAYLLIYKSFHESGSLIEVE